jgi:hypothetical protein
MLTVAEIKRAWIPLLAISAWLISGVGSFLTFSVDLSSTSSLGPIFVGATNVLVAALAGLLLLAARARSQLLRPNVWLVSSVALLIMFLGLLFAFVALQSIWTCPYARGNRLIIGAEPLSVLVDYLKRTGSSFSCNAVLDFAGDTLRLFALPNLLFRFLLLAAIYVGAWFSLTAFIFSIGAGLATKNHVARKAAKVG